MDLGSGDSASPPTSPALPSTPSRFVPSTAPLPTPSGPTPMVAPLPRWLVGVWVQDNGLDVVTGMRSRRIYTFHPDGVYEYRHEFCQTVEVCDGLVEWGHAFMGPSTLTILPQSQPNEGLRTFEFAVAPDPAVGDMTLQFILPDAIDVFYLQQ